MIPNWNGEDYLVPCLDSLRAQTYQDHETIVVDNGSVDGSLDILRQRGDVRLVELDVNRGFAGGVNAGIAVARGELVALLNNDTVADEHWIEELVAAMEHGDIATSLMLNHDDPSLIDSSGVQMSRWGMAYPRERDHAGAEAHQDYAEVFAASGGATMYKKAVFEHVGLFDDAFFAYYEDVDLSFRARLAGHVVVLAPNARVLHHINATANRLDSRENPVAPPPSREGFVSPFVRYHLFKNVNYVFYKNFPRRTLLKLLPRFLSLQVLMIAAAVRNGAGAVVARSYVELLRSIPSIARKRRAVQALRVVPPAIVEGWLTDHWPLATPRPALFSGRATRAGDER